MTLDHQNHGAIVMLTNYPIDRALVADRRRRRLEYAERMRRSRRSAPYAAKRGPVTSLVAVLRSWGLRW